MIALLFGGAMAGLLAPAPKTQTLVLLDNWATVETHSYFFDHLATQLNHKVHFEMIFDEEVSYESFNGYKYQNVILMAPSAKGKHHA